MKITRDQAISIAVACAKANPPSYFTVPFQPHEWVIDAIMFACNGKIITAGVDVARDRVEIGIASWPNPPAQAGQVDSEFTVDSAGYFHFAPTAEPVAPCTFPNCECPTNEHDKLCKFEAAAEPAAQGEAADDLAMQLACEHGETDEAGTGYMFSMEQFDDFIRAFTAAQPRAVPDGWRETILSVLSALDVATGDSDPNIGPDMNDDEVREEYPEVWAMQQLSAMLAAAPSATPGESAC